MTPMNVMVTVALAVITSAGFWSILQLIITRKGRIAEISRQDAETEHIRQTVLTSEVERKKLITEVESAALASADRRYAHLRDDYDEIKGYYKEQREALVTVVDVLDTLVFRMRAAPDSHDQITLSVSSNEFLTARSALVEARKHLR